MLQRLFLVIMMAFVVTGCGPRYVDYFPYFDDGTCKPCVAILPVRDCAKGNLAWDLSEEITSTVKCRIRDNASLFLLSEKSVDKTLGRIPNADYFSRDLSFAREFVNCEYVVVMEIIEHSILPYERGRFSPLYPSSAGSRCNSVLAIKVRLRIIDIRDEDRPCIVLQEIVESNHMIPREREFYDYSRDQWGSNEYLLSPFGQAHQRLAKDLVNRIENITWSAK